MSKLNLLFVCGRNQWRSPTAVEVFRSDPRLNVRSAGISPSSRHLLSEKDLNWADWVLVMETKHRSRILDRFRHQLELPPMDVLDIPDRYTYMDPELIELVRDQTEHLLATK